LTEQRGEDLGQHRIAQDGRGLQDRAIRLLAADSRAQR
jgi:hypothetical protein